jgi:hypothetical protein
VVPTAPRLSPRVAAVAWLLTAALTFVVVCQPFPPAALPAACGLVPGELLTLLGPSPVDQPTSGDGQWRTACAWATPSGNGTGVGTLQVTVERRGPSVYRKASDEAQDVFDATKRFDLREGGQASDLHNIASKRSTYIQPLSAFVAHMQPDVFTPRQKPYRPRSVPSSPPSAVTHTAKTAVSGVAPTEADAASL